MGLWHSNSLIKTKYYTCEIEESSGRTLRASLRAIDDSIVKETLGHNDKTKCTRLRQLSLLLGLVYHGKWQHMKQIFSVSILTWWHLSLNATPVANKKIPAHVPPLYNYGMLVEIT